MSIHLKNILLHSWWKIPNLVTRSWKAGPSRKRINVKWIWSGMGKRYGKFSQNADSVFTKVLNTGKVSPV